MKAKTFHCSVITPEREVLSTEATAAVFTAHDGQVGILFQRAPMVYLLGVGNMHIDDADGRHNLFINGGFVQMLDNNLTILTSSTDQP